MEPRTWKSWKSIPPLLLKNSSVAFPPHHYQDQNPNDCRIVVATKPKLHTACTIDYECIISDQTRSDRASPLSFKAKSPCVAFALSFPIEVREEPQKMCVTKKTNRRPQSFAAAATFLGASSPVGPSSTTSSRFASASPMISPMSCLRPIHPPPEAEPSTSSATIDATTATYSTSSRTRKRQRMSTVVSSPTYPNRRQKSVTFSAVTVVKTTVVPSSTMTDERKDELWYGRNALENFKKAARRDGKAHRRESMSMPLSSRTALTSSDGDYSSSSSDDDTNGFSSPGSCSQRGLENRISLLLERQRNKYVAHRAILECARRLASSPLSLPSPPNRPASTIPVDADDHLALVSSKVTRWSREVALSTGRNNFYAAYPEEAAAQNNVRSCRCPHGLALQQINARYPFPVSFKRNGPAGMGSTTTPTTMATSPSSTTGAATFAAAIAVADFGPIPTKFNVSSIQEDDSDDEHRRRLAKRRRR